METVVETGVTMQVEVTITADRNELSEINDLIAGLDTDTSLDVTQEAEEETADLDLSEEERYIIAALHDNPRSALRVVHRAATELEGSPFDDYHQEDGWNDERTRIRELLWSMKSEGLVDNDGQLWYPTDDAPTNVLD